ncbi:TPA: hypothetical protein ACH3X1_009598 [Trebouxia sp. C0004]
MAFEIQRDRLLAEVDNVHDVLVRKHNSGLVLCKCDDCSSEDISVWERNNFVHRSKAYRHMIAQCKRKRTAVTEKDKQKDFSFWRPESVVILYKREVVAALQAELDEQPFQGADEQAKSPPLHKLLPNKLRYLMKSFKVDSRTLGFSQKMRTWQKQTTHLKIMIARGELHKPLLLQKRMACWGSLLT